MSTSAKANELASEFETAAESFARFLEELSPEQWSTTVPGEERTVAALARHIGWGFGYEMIAFNAFSESRPFEAVTLAQFAELNAANGAEYAACPQPDTIQFIRDEAALAAAQVRGFSDESLARRGQYVDIAPERSVEEQIQRVLIAHIGMHERTIREALDLGAPA